MLKRIHKVSFLDIKSQISNLKSQIGGFTLVELMISISIIAILTAAIIPSFTDFSKSQTLNQSLKTLKSDLRVAQSRSISGSTIGGSVKAWGVYFDTASPNQYQIIACTPAANLLQYGGYTYGGTQCPTAPVDTSTVKTVTLSSQVKILSLIPSLSNALSVVFDSQNGAAYVNGSTLSGDAKITLSYADADGSGQVIVTVTPGGGISD